jgi:hypothetical protein
MPLRACTTMLSVPWSRLKTSLHRGDVSAISFWGLRSATPRGVQKRRENKPLRERFVRRTLKPAHLYRIYDL